MSLRYRLRVLSATGAELESASGEFDDGEAQLLKRFREFADTLSQTKFAREGMDGPLTIAWSANGQVSTKLPSDEVVSEFTHRLRPFVLEKEPTFFNRVRGVLYRRLSAAAIRNRLERWKEQFSGELTARAYRVTAGQTVINSDATLRLWLNSFEYHRDEDKRAAMDAIYQYIPESACRFYFFDLSVSKAEAVLAMAELIRQMENARSAQ